MTAKELNKLRKALPAKWPDQIRKRLKSQLSTRQIQRIVGGEFEDNHGVIHIAISLETKEKRRLKKLNESVKNI